MPVPDPAITRARVFHAASGCACPHGLHAGLRSNARHRPGLSVKGRTHARGWHCEFQD